MKKVAVFLFVFLMAVQKPFPAFAQTKANPIYEVELLSTCYNAFYDKVTKSYHKATNQDLEIDEDLKLRFLKAMIPPKEITTMDKADSWLVAAGIYIFFEEAIRNQINKAKPGILDANQAVDWKKVTRAPKIAELEEIVQKVPDLQHRMVELGKYPDVVSKSEEIISDPAQIKKLRSNFEEIMKKVNKTDKDLASFEAKSSGAIKWIKFKWGVGYWILQTIALTGYIVTLEIFPELRGLGPNRFPTSLQTLHNTTSIYEYLMQLSSVEPDVSNLRKFMARTCKWSLAQDMDLWMDTLTHATPDQIVFAMGGLPPPTPIKENLPTPIKQKSVSN